MKTSLQDTIVREVLVQAPRERVYAALTDAGQLAQWFPDAVEGEIIKRRYKVVRVGINSLVVEDVEFKNEQTLPLQDS